MYTIELTRGPGWDAPVVATHAVQSNKHIVDVERLALSLIQGARPLSNLQRPTDFRILNHLGRCVGSSATAAGSLRSASRAGRTYWGEAR